MRLARKKMNDQQMPRFMMIPLEQIYPNPYQPRKTFDQEALAELATSIRLYGVIQPIAVRQVGRDEYELVAGERRLRAAKMAGLREIPATLTQLEEQDSAMLAMIENLQREGLHFLEEAQGYYRLLQEHGLTQEALARRIGKSQSAVANKLRLLRLSSPVRDAIIRGGLSERHARALLKAPDEETQLSVARAVVEQELTVRQTEELVNQSMATQPVAAPVFTPVDRKAEPNGMWRQGRSVTRFYDPRLFLNTMKNAVSELKREGMEAEYEEERTKEAIVVTVRIPLAKRNLRQFI